jgi:Sec-independent protein translocase protein TatA
MQQNALREFRSYFRSVKQKTRKESMPKTKKNKLSERKKDSFHKALKKKLNQQFGGLKIKNLGDGLTEISIK